MKRVQIRGGEEEAGEEGLGMMYRRLKQHVHWPRTRALGSAISSLMEPLQK